MSAWWTFADAHPVAATVWIVFAIVGALAALGVGKKPQPSREEPPK